MKEARLEADNKTDIISAQWVHLRPQTQGQAKHDFPVSGSCVRKLGWPDNTLTPSS